MHLREEFYRLQNWPDIEMFVWYASVSVLHICNIIVPEVVALYSIDDSEPQQWML